MRKIKKLPIELINQIAAGEVIERPAAVIKELVENSIDAGADWIEITVYNAGVGSIKVRDNGSGIAQDEMLLAIAPHATSKLYSLSELLTINSLGFRGEALASISAVSRFKLISKVASSDKAWMLENNQLLPTAHPTGTTIEVNDLFFNIKARRYFLKSKQTENWHIQEMVTRLILSNFNVAFKFIAENKIIFDLPQATNEALQQERLAKVIGKSFVQNMQAIVCHNDSMELSGWLGKAAYHTAQSDQQYVFLNGRAIKDKVLLHAIKSCYRDLCPVGRAPAFVLYFAINPREVDVNVHPTKSEVRFRKMRLVYDFLRANIMHVLDKDQILPLPFTGEVDARPQAVAAGEGIKNGDESKNKDIKIIKIFFNRYALIEINNCNFIADLPQLHAATSSKIPWEKIATTITPGEIRQMIINYGFDKLIELTADFLQTICN